MQQLSGTNRYFLYFAQIILSLSLLMKYINNIASVTRESGVVYCIPVVYLSKILDKTNTYLTGKLSRQTFSKDDICWKFSTKILEFSFHFYYQDDMKYSIAKKMALFCIYPTYLINNKHLYYIWPSKLTENQGNFYSIFKISKQSFFPLFHSV